MAKRRRNRKKKSQRTPQTQARGTLSVCMIVKNEAARVRRAIECIKPFADEIVVVDTGSEDDTLEILQSLDVKIGHFKWCDDFAAARNASLDLATGDWIMWLDADDYIPSSEWPKLRKLKKMKPDKGFMFILKNEGHGKESFWQLRMFPNLPNIRFIYPVHEQVAPSLEKAGFPLIKADVTVVHTGYDSRETVLAKKNRNLKLLLRRTQAQPDDLLSRLFVGLMYFSIDKIEETIEYLGPLVADRKFYAEHREPYAIAAIFLARAHLKYDRYEEAKRILENILACGHKSGLLFVTLSKCYNQLDLPEKALELLEKYSPYITAPTLIPSDLEALESNALFQKALALKKMGRLKEAFLLCRKHSDGTSRFDDLKLLAEDIAKEIESRADAARVFEGIISSSYATPDDLFRYANALIRDGDLTVAQNAYEDVLKRDPLHIRARRALAALLRNKGRLAEAASLLEEGLGYSGTTSDLLPDLLDLYFEQKQWEKILAIQVREDAFWPVRFAAYVHSGSILEASDEEIYSLLKPAIHSLGTSTELTIEKIWESSCGLNQREKFYLATACAKLDPSLKSAVSVAVGGYLDRGRATDALDLIEQFIQHHPDDPDGFKWLAKCYEMQGAKEAAALSHKQANKLSGASSFEVPGVLEKAL